MYQNLNFNWSNRDMNTVLPVIVALLCFNIYWFVSQSGRIKSYYYSKYEFDKASVRHIFFTKFFGFIVMGIFPALICLGFLPQFKLAHYGVTIISHTILFSVFWSFGLGAVVMLLAFFSAGKEENLANYPQIRANRWSKETVWIYAIGWALYLFGYEFLFRGVLLIPLAYALGPWPAIGINVALYSATHLPKGMKETMGAIPLGLVLCLLTLYSGTIWIAFFVHLVMALTNSFRALYLHPELHYKPELK